MIGSKSLTALLPFYEVAEKLLIGEQHLNNEIKIERKSTQDLLIKIKRQKWVEGLYVCDNELGSIKRYKNSEGTDKNDIEETQFLSWIRSIELNTCIVEMADPKVGLSVFVAPGKILPKDTFIASTGIIKLNPSVEDIETKVHCSALQDLNSPHKKIYGIIDPEKIGGILDLINHAPNKEDADHFKFSDPSIEDQIAYANLRSKIRYYQGYAIMGVEVIADIEGGEHGRQLLWSYASANEYVLRHHADFEERTLVLFDKTKNQIIPPKYYDLKEIDIYIDAGKLILRKIATLTRWQIMESSPESALNISTDDSYADSHSSEIQSPILFGILQKSLKKNRFAEKIILSIPGLIP